jgi:hypothetical protein
MNVMKKLAPKALQVHSKFHLFKKLSDAIDKIRKSELAENPLSLIFIRLQFTSNNFDLLFHIFTLIFKKYYS